MTTTMERLNTITMGLNKCKPIDEIFGVFDDTNKKIKGSLEAYYASKKSKEVSKDAKKPVKEEEKKSSLTEKKEECSNVNVILLGYNSNKEEASKDAKKPVKEEEKKSSLTEKDAKKPINEKSKITLENRMECPVHVMTNEEAIKKYKKVELNKDEQHRIKHLVHHLHENGLVFTEPQKMSTGLYETNITQTNGNVVPVSIDNDGRLYSDEIKFFIGHMNPGDEYEPTRPCFYMTKDSLAALKNGQMIPEKYMVPQELFILNKLVDLTSLKEKDPQKRSETFRNVSRIFTDKETFNAILKNANGESYRFAFCRYKSPDEFSLTSSGRNLLSNLSDEKQKVTKEQWINYKDKKIDLKVKSRTK